MQFFRWTFVTSSEPIIPGILCTSWWSATIFSASDFVGFLRYVLARASQHTAALVRFDRHLLDVASQTMNTVNETPQYNIFWAQRNLDYGEMECFPALERVRLHSVSCFARWLIMVSTIWHLIRKMHSNVFCGTLVLVLTSHSPHNVTLAHNLIQFIWASL